MDAALDSGAKNYFQAWIKYYSRSIWKVLLVPIKGWLYQKSANLSSLRFKKNIIFVSLWVESSAFLLCNGYHRHGTKESSDMCSRVKLASVVSWPDVAIFAPFGRYSEALWRLLPGAYLLLGDFLLSIGLFFTQIIWSLWLLLRGWIYKGSASTSLSIPCTLSLFNSKLRS